MSEVLAGAELVVKAIAQTCIDNEGYFTELDAVVGDGDFGYSLARGFEKLLDAWDDLDRTDVAKFLVNVGIVISSRVGGTSGPLWGTAFMRAGKAVSGGCRAPSDAVISMLRAAIDGIKARGHANLGDKTLLDSLVPFTERLEAEFERSVPSVDALSAATGVAREAAEATSSMIARRGRASYTGERSKGSVDAGAMAVAVLVERVNEVWKLSVLGGKVGTREEVRE